MTCTNTRIQIRNLSNLTTDPHRAGDKMLEAVKANVKLVKKVQVKNLLEGLEKRRIGTNEIEIMAKKLVNSEDRDEAVVVRLVGIVKEAAQRREKASKKAFYLARREAIQVLPAGWMRSKLLVILRSEAQGLWSSLKQKNVKKKDHLEKRHRPQKEEGTIKGMQVGDKELGVDETVVEVLAYNVELTENEVKYLKFPNSFTDFVKVDKEKIMTEIQTMAANFG